MSKLDAAAIDAYRVVFYAHVCDVMRFSDVSRSFMLATISSLGISDAPIGDEAEPALRPELFPAVGNRARGLHQMRAIDGGPGRDFGGRFPAREDATHATLEPEGDNDAD